LEVEQMKFVKRFVLIALPLLFILCLAGAGIHIYPLVKTEESLAQDAWHLKPLPENAAEMIATLPSQRQIRHGSETEFYAFFHFGVNTFTDSEWGAGTEDPAVFNPTHLDTDQWIENIAAAGMTGAILTAKHHDGFCLWPSAYTEHSVKNSPYDGDVVAQFAESCRKYGVKFGFYLSPWDRNTPAYGQAQAYNGYYANQLTELLTNYGEVFEVWFDGAIGEEYQGIQTYDWDRWVALVRKLQPDACTAIAPPVPDIAWVGNEHGLADGNVSSVKGSGNQRFWAKNECDVSIRRGWFYHENQRPKGLGELMRIYYNSVGMNCTLLLNIPPNREGQLNEKDVKRLQEMGEAIRAITAREISTEMAELREGENIYALDFKLDSAQKARHVVLSEDVNRFGERVTQFSVYAKVGRFYLKVGESESAGAKTIVRLRRFAPRTGMYRIVIEQARGAPVLQSVHFYR